MKKDNAQGVEKIRLSQIMKGSPLWDQDGNELRYLSCKSPRKFRALHLIEITFYFSENKKSSKRKKIYKCNFVIDRPRSKKGEIIVHLGDLSTSPLME